MGLTLMLAMAMATQAPSGPDCMSALAGAFEDGSDAPLAGQIDGARIRGRDGLVALRAARGDEVLIIAGGQFTGADFHGLRLHNICFLGTDLSGSNWSEVDAPGIAFARADLSGANLAGARMPRLLLREPHMPDVDASRADFSNGRLAGGWNGSLAGLRLDGANLRGFRFECGLTVEDGCPIEGEISFRGADLQNAAIDTYWGGGDWTGATLDRTIVRLEQLLDFGTAELAGPLIVRGGDTTAELAPEEIRALEPHIGPAGLASGPSSAPSAPPPWARPGATALFVAPNVAFDDAVRQGAIYARLVPVVVGAAWSRVAVRVNEDGTIDARGDAVGANAHQCWLGGDRLRLDPATGWYSGPQPPSDEDPPEWRGRPMPVLRLWDDRGEVFGRGHYGAGGNGDPRFSDYAGCGVRAGFLPMIRVPVPDAEARAVFESFPDPE